MIKSAAVAVAAGLVLVAGCSSSSSTGAAPHATSSTAPSCDTVTAPGQPATQAVLDAGCTMHSGSTFLLDSTAACDVVSYTSDGLERWASIGDVWREANGPVAEDSDYRAAYHC